MSGLLKTTAVGAAAFAAAQHVDMALTRRAPSDTPVILVERVVGRPLHGPTRTLTSYTAQSSVALVAALAARTAGDHRRRRLMAAYATALATGTLADPALGACPWPWDWTRQDWLRELSLKGALAIAVT